MTFLYKCCIIIKIVCLILFDESEKYNIKEIEDNNDLGKIERESTTIEEKN